MHLLLHSIITEHAIESLFLIILDGKGKQIHNYVDINKMNFV